MYQQLRVVFGATFAIVLFTLAMAFAYRQLTGIYSYVEASVDWRGITATLVVGSMIYSLTLRHWAAKIAFWLIVISVAGATAINTASPLGLINYFPPLWGLGILLVVAGGVGFAVTVASIGIREQVTEPLAEVLGIEIAPLPPTKALPKPEPKRKILGFGTRLGGFFPKPKPTDGADTETAEPRELLYLTMQTLAKAGPNGKEGRVAAAAAQLNISTAGVNKRLRELYKQQPRVVEANIPNWVQRNIKDDAKV